MCVSIPTAFSASDGIATVSNDYSVPGDSIITFTDGARTSTKSFPILRDNNLELLEDFQISIALRSDATSSLLSSPSSTSVLIKDRKYVAVQTVNVFVLILYIFKKNELN